MSNFAELVLTFDSWQQAQDYADQLFEQKLAEQIEFLPVKDSSGQSNIKLIVKTKEANLDLVGRIS